MNMISQLRRRFSETEKVTLSIEEYNVLQAEWITRCLDKETSKDFATKFYYWWHNQPGTNTNQGYDSWLEHLEKVKSGPISETAKWFEAIKNSWSQ